MTCIRIPELKAVLSVGEPTLTLRANSKDYIFEFSDRFGPLFFNRKGREAASPSMRSIFWSALNLWIQQGKRSCDGRCMWDAIEERDIVKHFGGRNYMVIGSEMAVPEWFLAEKA